MGKVKVEVLAEQLTYSEPNGDGTHTRNDYVRGQVFEMEEDQALAASAGEVQALPSVEKNSAGTHVFRYPPRTPGVARASVRILSEAAKVTAPAAVTVVTPAKAPKPGGRGD